jgi:hypothetical protein
MTTHTNCTHPATKAARAACRKASHEAARNTARVSVEELQAAVDAMTKTAPADYSSMKYEFENTTCGRCAGTGTYPSAAWNGVCLGCNGRGWVLTRAGKAAKAIHDQWITDHLTITAAELKVGDKFRPNAVDGWKTVVEIDPNGGTVTTTIGSGDNAVTTTKQNMIIRTIKTSYGMPADSPVIRSATPDERNLLIDRIAKLKGTLLTPR